VLNARVAMSAEQKLITQNIVLPAPPAPLGNYTTAATLGDALYLSGHLPASAEGIQATGKLGSTLSVDEGYRAARQAGVSLLATVRKVLGSLDKVERVVKVVGFVNCTADFEKHPQVLNGCSDLLVEVFGERGVAPRSAVGAGSLPGNVAVEIEAIFQIKTD
jgi:enamine deaminase RidA (YjgF/YER057c/UK114 family)